MDLFYELDRMTSPEPCCSAGKVLSAAVVAELVQAGKVTDPALIAHFHMQMRVSYPAAIRGGSTFGRSLNRRRVLV